MMNCSGILEPKAMHDTHDFRSESDVNTPNVARVYDYLLAHLTVISDGPRNGKDA